MKKIISILLLATFCIFTQLHAQNRADELMDGVLLLSQNGRLINDLLMFFDRQLKDIQRLREEKCEEMENVRL